MPPKNINNQQLVHQLSTLIPNFCDKCGARHNKADVEIINQESGNLVCRLDCTNCGNSYVMYLNSPVDGIVAGRKTLIKNDVNAKEMRKFSGIEGLDNEEILDVFIKLKEVKTQKDFDSLFLDDINSLPHIK